MRAHLSMVIAASVFVSACQRGPAADTSASVTLDWERAAHEVVTSAEAVRPALDDRAAQGDLVAKDLAAGLDGSLNELTKTHATVVRELTRMGREASDADVGQLSGRMTDAVRRVETRVSRARALLSDEAPSAEPRTEASR
jgi:hypothetical protein